MSSRNDLARAAIALFAAISVSACVNFREFVDYQSLAIPSFAPRQTSPALQETTLEEYRLDSGDHLRVTVFGQADLTGEFAVDGSGMIAIPLLMPVVVRGMTPSEAGHTLEGILGQRLLRNPSVSVEVTQYRPFFILGEVNQPGQYPFVNGMTVRKAAAIAGGFTYRASTSGITITRRTEDGPIQGKATAEAGVMPGDTILVAERLF